jgi:hypothetical protein
MPKRWRTLQGGSYVWVIEEEQPDGTWAEIYRHRAPFDSEEDAIKDIKKLRKAKRRDSKGNDHDD